MKTSLPPNNSRRKGFTMLELLVAIAIVVALSGVGIQVWQHSKEAANLAKATQKIKDLGAAFVGYTTESGGLLPFEDAPGEDNWVTAAKPEASEAWYNALPRSMSQASVGDLAENDQEGQFYTDSYCLYVPGAPYPKGDKKLKRPLFAIGMNSRLQRKGDTDLKEQGTFASIIQPVNTVVFLERGLPKDKKVSKAQRNFSGKPKASPKAFAARHNQKGLLLFADGHVEQRRPSELITPAGRIVTPQTRVIWTRNPKDDPN